MNWLKVWWHAILNFHRNVLPGEDHRMCSYQTWTVVDGKKTTTPREHFCRCGYNDKHGRNKMWDEVEKP